MLIHLGIGKRDFCQKKKEVKDLFDEKFVKMWEFYFASCAAALSVSSAQVKAACMPTMPLPPS